MSSFSPAEKKKYWKQRIMDKLESTMKQIQIDFKGMNEDINHINLVQDDIRKAYTIINTGFSQLAKAIIEAPIVGEPVKLEKGQNAKKSEVKAGQPIQPK